VTQRLLIVDDHPGFRDLASAMLQDADFHVVGTATTGAQALAQLTECHPDVVLLDVRLPDTTGFEVCRAVLSIRPQVSVVLCSIHPAADFGTAMSGCGAKGFLPKAQLSGAALLALLK
jgi:DNA-binding NarL/FixJ family response regulator